MKNNNEKRMHISLEKEFNNWKKNDDILNQRVAPMQDTFTKLKRMLKQK